MAGVANVADVINEVSKRHSPNLVLGAAVDGSNMSDRAVTGVCVGGHTTTLRESRLGGCWQHVHYYSEPTGKLFLRL